MEHLLCLAGLVTTVYMQTSEPKSEILPKKASVVCYDQVGCFSNEPPFLSLQRLIAFSPQSPDQIKTRFILFTRNSLQAPQDLDARNSADALKVWTNLKSRPTKFIIHGFMDVFEISSWMKEMVKELLKFGDYNVVVVDWSGGNQFPYTQATANTRVVGAQVAVLVKHLIGAGKVTADNVHIIGHSLGAHTAGYAGERIPGLGRISGLDAAGPYFQDTDRQVRLDETDAIFVDNIHSDSDMAKILLSGLGTTTRSGHANFYPNGGHDQPGCKWAAPSHIAQGGLFEVNGYAISCSHSRAVVYFIESINSPCRFTAYPCSSESNFQAKLCRSCGDVGCSRMGFHADKYKAPQGQIVSYYLKTGAEVPFCRYRYTVDVKLATGPWSSVDGLASISLYGDLRNSSLITLKGTNPVTLSPGLTYTFEDALTEDVGNVNAVTFRWQQPYSFFWFLSWRAPIVYVEDIVVYAEEAGVKYKFCGKDKKVAPDSDIILNQPC